MKKTIAVAVTLFVLSFNAFACEKTPYNAPEELQPPCMGVESDQKDKSNVTDAGEKALPRKEVKKSETNHAKPVLSKKQASTRTR